VNHGTRMRLALDLILRPHNLMLRNFIESATRNYNKEDRRELERSLEEAPKQPSLVAVPQRPATAAATASAQRRPCSPRIRLLFSQASASELLHPRPRLSFETTVTGLAFCLRRAATVSTVPVLFHRVSPSVVPCSFLATDLLCSVLAFSSSLCSVLKMLSDQRKKGMDWIYV
ncbi:hypothetical protein S245_021296, partial [Arachis hypogaea]